VGAVAIDLEGSPGSLRELVGESDLEVLAEGFVFVEGPAWHPIECHLTFNDIPGDRMLRWDRVSGVSTLRSPNGMGNGNTYDSRMRLLTCEHRTSRLVRTEADGSVTVLADRFGGAELNSPNDVIVDSAERVLFTDPAYGRTSSFVGVPREPELSVRGVYALDPDGALRCLTEEMESPNGLCLSPDERYLYVAETERHVLRRYRYQNGYLSDGEVWARLQGTEPEGPDGLRVDELGNVWCAGPGGLQVFSPDGALLGRVRMPEVVANLTWGDDDRRTLFVCATTSVYALRTRVAGCR
jgi:gluconolactonase